MLVKKKLYKNLSKRNVKQAMATNKRRQEIFSIVEP
jgi:hypothetical protein